MAEQINDGRNEWATDLRGAARQMDDLNLCDAYRVGQTICRGMRRHGVPQDAYNMFALVLASLRHAIQEKEARTPDACDVIELEPLLSISDIAQRHIEDGSV